MMPKKEDTNAEAVASILRLWLNRKFGLENKDSIGKLESDKGLQACRRMIEAATLIPILQARVRRNYSKKPPDTAVTQMVKGKY